MYELLKDLELILKKIGTGKAIAIVAFIVFAIILLLKNKDLLDSVDIKINLRPADQVTTTAKSENAPQSSSGRPTSPAKSEPVNYPNLIVTSLSVPPVRFDNPNYIYFRLENTGTADAFDTTITLDFGNVAVKAKEIRQSSVCKFSGGNGNTSIVYIQCDRIPNRSYVDFYFLASDPRFDQVHVRANNLQYPKVYKFGDLAQPNTEGSGGLSIFLQILFSVALTIVVGALVIKFCVWLFRD